MKKHCLMRKDNTPNISQLKAISADLFDWANRMGLAGRRVTALEFKVTKEQAPGQYTVYCTEPDEEK